MFNIISISWIYWHLFTDIIWSILENVSCVLEIKVYSAAIGWNVVYKSIKSILSNVLLKASVSLFSLAVLSTQLCLSDWTELFSPLCNWCVNVSSVQFSCSVLSDSLRPHELQHTRPPCPTPIPGAYPNSCPLSQSCHPTISSSVIPFSSCPHSQHQGLFKWVHSSYLVAKVLEFQLQHQSYQWTLRTDLL